MKAYKIKENQTQFLVAGKLMCEIEGQVMLLATPTDPQMFYDKGTFGKLKDRGMLEEVELEEEKWVLPHLYKPIKILILGHS